MVKRGLRTRIHLLVSLNVVARFVFTVIAPKKCDGKHFVLEYSNVLLFIFFPKDGMGKKYYIDAYINYMNISKLRTGKSRIVVHQREYGTHIQANLKSKE